MKSFKYSLFLSAASALALSSPLVAATALTLAPAGLQAPAQISQLQPTILADVTTVEAKVAPLPEPAKLPVDTTTEAKVNPVPAGDTPPLVTTTTEPQQPVVATEPLQQQPQPQQLAQQPVQSLVAVTPQPTAILGTTQPVAEPQQVTQQPVQSLVAATPQPTAILGTTQPVAEPQQLAQQPVQSLIAVTPPPTLLTNQPLMAGLGAALNLNGLAAPTSVIDSSQQPQPAATLGPVIDTAATTVATLENGAAPTPSAENRAEKAIEELLKKKQQEQLLEQPVVEATEVLPLTATDSTVGEPVALGGAVAQTEEAQPEAQLSTKLKARLSKKIAARRAAKAAAQGAPPTEETVVGEPPVALVDGGTVTQPEEAQPMTPAEERKAKFKALREKIAARRATEAAAKVATQAEAAVHTEETVGEPKIATSAETPAVVEPIVVEKEAEPSTPVESAPSTPELSAVLVKDKDTEAMLVTMTMNLASNQANQPETPVTVIDSPVGKVVNPITDSGEAPKTEAAAGADKAAARKAAKDAATATEVDPSNNLGEEPAAEPSAEEPKKVVEEAVIVKGTSGGERVDTSKAEAGVDESRLVIGQDAIIENENKNEEAAAAA